MHMLRGGVLFSSCCTGYVAIHPLRRDAPVTSRRTRYVAIHPIRRGVMPTDRVHRVPQQAQPRPRQTPTVRLGRSHAATQPRHARPGSTQEALHHLGSIAPPPSRCNTPLSGVTPARNKQQCGYAPQHASRNARQEAQRRLKRRREIEKHAPSTTTKHALITPAPTTASTTNTSGAHEIVPHNLACNSPKATPDTSRKR